MRECARPHDPETECAEPIRPLAPNGRRSRNPISRRRFSRGTPGAFVRCAVSGVPIPLEELKYWSVDLQEAYASPDLVLQRYYPAQAKRLTLRFGRAACAAANRFNSNERNPAASSKRQRYRQRVRAWRTPPFYARRPSGPSPFRSSSAPSRRALPVAQTVGFGPRIAVVIRKATCRRDRDAGGINVAKNFSGLPMPAQANASTRRPPCASMKPASGSSHARNTGMRRALALATTFAAAAAGPITSTGMSVFELRAERRAQGAPPASPSRCRRRGRKSTHKQRESPWRERGSETRRPSR